MSDGFGPILESVVAATGVERYRFLCLDHPDPVVRAEYSAFVRRRHAELAGGTPQYPPLAVQAGNVSRALWDWAVSGFSVAGQDEQGRRRAICAACPQYVPGSNRCKLCGCLLAAKIRMRTEHCPIEKW